jgi:flagellar hook-basal body complex protein FliE
MQVNFAVPSSVSGLATAGPTPSSAPFGDTFRNAVAGIDGLEQKAATAVEGLLQGSGVDVHEAMIATQKADMAFEMALAVRNKAVAAYQQVMGMQF